MKNIPQNITELLESFSEISNIKERFQFLLELSEELEPFDDSQKNSENKILGCASDAWIRVQENADTLNTAGEKIIKISGIGDAVISTGILSFFIQCFEGLSAAEILEMKSAFAEALLESKIISSLSPSRANGAKAMLEKIYSECEKLV